MGPLLKSVIDINPSIIVTALVGTAVIFGSYTLSAVFAKRGSWFFLGGTLMTILNSLLLLVPANLFFVYLLSQGNMYLGLLVMCGCILFDILLIIEKERNGDRDFVTHSMNFFLDFINIFRRLLVILTGKVSSLVY
jgi:FtsH-binding integral membrane protein